MAMKITDEFIACGSSGVLDDSLARGTVVVPNAAVRDEGTSYHYAAPSREIAADADVVGTIGGTGHAGDPVPRRQDVDNGCILP